MRRFDVRTRSLAGGLLALLSLTLVGSCSSARDDDGAVAGTGVLRHVQLEGGCWALETDDERWELLNLERDFGAELQVDGLRVRFEGTARDDVMTTCQLGPNLELTSLEKAD